MNALIHFFTQSTNTPIPVWYLILVNGLLLWSIYRASKYEAKFHQLQTSVRRTVKMQTTEAPYVAVMDQDVLSLILDDSERAWKAINGVL